jgi:hypothetical protein
MLPKLKNTTIDGSGSLDLSFVQAKGPLPFKTNGKIQLKGVGTVTNYAMQKIFAAACRSFSAGLDNSLSRINPRSLPSW